MQVKRNKLITLVACTTLLASLLSACGSSDNAGSTSGNASKNSEVSSSVDSDNPYKEPMEISIAFWDIDSEISKIDQDPIAQEILNKFNIKIKPVNTTWDDYAQKIQMWASSGQLPDIFAIDALGTQYQRKWVDQGVVKDLPDLTKYRVWRNSLKRPTSQG